MALNSKQSALCSFPPINQLVLVPEESASGSTDMNEEGNASEGFVLRLIISKNCTGFPLLLSASVHPAEMLATGVGGAVR